jgi:branched-chain amino acid transport system permease protein
VIYSIYVFVGPGIPMFLLSVAAGCLAMAALGFVIERLLISRMYQRELPEQLLLTFSLVLIIGDVIRFIWGVSDRSVSFNIEPLEIFGTFVNPYQFVVIGLGLSVALALWAFLRFTRYGRIVRAAVHSREMVSALGIRIQLIYGGVFALGLALAALAAGAFLPTAPMALGVDIDLIIQSFAVVVIGGFGSILGTFVASLIVGIVYAFSILVWPNGALAVVFLIVVGILIWRPWGLFGSELRT